MSGCAQRSTACNRRPLPRRSASNTSADATASPGSTNGETLDDRGRAVGIELILPDWFYAGVLDRGLILTIDRAYFALTGGVERWLYRIVRKHGGHQRGGWSFDVPHLHLKSGALSPLKQFAFELRTIVRRQSLPGYHLSLEHSFGRERLIFKPIPVDPFVAAARRVGFPVEKLA